MIEDARWADEGQSIILATIDGKPVQVPADPANRHYQDIVRLGIKIAAFLNPPLTAMDYAQAVSDHIETTAQNRGYDSQDLLASYVLSDVPAWKAEAQAFITWRDLVWAYVFMSQAAVASEQRTQPEIEAFKSELPQIQWPEG